MFIFRYILKLFFILVTLGAIAVAGAFYYYTHDLPDYSQLADYTPPSVTRFYAIDGQLMEEYAYEHRLFIPISAIPKSLVEAFISAEDKNFYEHQGLDPVSIIKAVISNIVNLAQNKKLQGASTITQQVVKNFLLTSERSFTRKIKEAILAYKISQVFSKDQILELYLNQIYLGNNAYGVQAASLAYFNKSVEELDLSESAFLAVMPKAPSYYEKNYPQALARRKYVLERMVTDGYISAQTASKANAQEVKLVKNQKKDKKTFSAGFYAEHVRGEIINKYGSDALYKEGLTVITSLNPQYQTWADSALREGLRRYDMSRGYRGPIGRIKLDEWATEVQKIHNPEGLLEYEIAVLLNIKEKDHLSIGLKDGSKAKIPHAEYSWAVGAKKPIAKSLQGGDIIIVEKLPTGSYALRQIPKINGAIVAIKPSTGQILAMSGGYDFSSSKFNRVTQALRQPGSAIKPFVYLAGLENNIEPNTIFSDGPLEVYLGPGLPLWRPKNYGEDYLGNITMRKGFELSRNLVTIRVAQRVGIKKVIEIIKRLGINDNPANMYSSVLGALETTPLKLTNAYAAILNGGNKVYPSFIELIQDRNGHLLYSRPGQICSNCTKNFSVDNIPQIKQKEQITLIPADSNYQIISFLMGAVQRGTAQKAKSLSPYIGGKTGTTNDSLDTWFIGFKNDLVVGVYVGYDTPKTLGAKATGSSVALPIFIDFMKNVIKENPPIDFIHPNNIELVPIDPKNGEIIERGGIVEALKIHRHQPESEVNDVFDIMITP